MTDCGEIPDRTGDPYIEGTEDDDLRALIERCTPHYPPTEEARRRHESVRINLRIVADHLVQVCPASSERDQAVWLLMNDVMFYANAAIARNHGSLEPPIYQDGPTADNPEPVVASMSSGTGEPMVQEGPTLRPGETGELTEEGHICAPGLTCRCPGGLGSHRY
jgi:hypothetical protein